MAESSWRRPLGSRQGGEAGGVGQGLPAFIISLEIFHFINYLHALYDKNYNLQNREKERGKRKRKEDQGNGKDHLRDETESNRKQERGHCGGRWRKRVSAAWKEKEASVSSSVIKEYGN